MPLIPAGALSAFAGVVISLICIIFLLALIFLTLRYISMTALIRMVNGYEVTGERVSVGQGFRLGWSRGTWRIFLADLLVGVVAAVVFILLFLIAAAPLLLWATRSQAGQVIGTVLTISLAILVIILLIVTIAAITILLELAHRAIVLEGMGVIDGLRRGWALFRRRLGDVIIMALILFGLGLAFLVLMVPVFFLLLLAGIIVALLPALLAGGLTAIFVHGQAPFIVGAAIGLPILILVIGLPLLFLGGLWETYRSSAWTLTFRELLTLEAVQPPLAPEPASPATAPVEPGPASEEPPLA